MLPLRSVGHVVIAHFAFARVIEVDGLPVAGPGDVGRGRGERGTKLLEDQDRVGVGCVRVRNVVGGALKTWPKPNASHSLVTPTQVPAAVRCSIPLESMDQSWPTGVAGLVVSSPINGIEAQVFFSPLSV